MKNPTMGSWIHEDALDKFYAQGDSGKQEDPVLNTMKDALRVMRSTVDRCAETTTTILKNEMQTRVRNMRDAANSNYARFLKASPAFDEARRIAQSEVARIVDTTSSPASTQYDSEIRASLKAMSREEREDAIDRAIANGEDTVVAAIFGGPSMLSGLTTTQRDLYRERWRARRFPQELDRQRRLEAALKVFDGLGSVAQKHVLALTDDDAVRRAEQTEIAARAAINAA